MFLIFFIIFQIIQIQVICYRSKCVNIPPNYLMQQLEGNAKTTSGQSTSTKIVDGIMTNTAINYDGTYYMDMGPTNIGGQFSLHYWVNLKQQTAHCRFMDFATYSYDIDSGNGNTNSIAIGGKATSNGLRLIINDQASASNELYWEGGTYPMNQWAHIVVTIGINRIVKVYKNGVDITSTADLNNTGISSSDIPTRSRPYSRFGKANVNKPPLRAHVDEMTLYNRVLTGQEIQCLYDTCSYQCSTCTETSTNCQSCAGNRTGIPNCTCPNGFYEATINQVTCSGTCLISCLTCSGSTSCDICQSSSPERTGQTCQCPQQYYDSGVAQCSQCILGCQICSNGTTCTTCISGSNRSGDNCQCQPGYQDTGTEICDLICEFPCTQCSGTASNCTQCESSTPSRIGSSCICPDTFYSSGTTPQCQQCQYPCVNCSSSNECTTCVQSSPSRLDSTCSCPDGYYNQGTTAQCQQCQHPCVNCNNSNVCTSCVSSSPTRLGLYCQCPNGYYNQGKTAQCQQCQYPCVYCSSSNVCTSCGFSSPTRSGLTCQCPDGYYNQGTITQCQQCQHPCVNCSSSNVCTSCVSSSPTRSGLTCSCPDGYYNQGTTAQCQQCQHPCVNCSSSNVCTTCVSSSPSRLDSTCSCPDGYYNQGTTAQCQQCQHPCVNCSNSNVCSTCVSSSPSRLDSTCSCPDGYYNQGSIDQCQQCQHPCTNCVSFSICTQCVNSNPARNGSSCQCPKQYYNDGTTAQCQDCLWTCLTCNVGNQCQSCKVSSTATRVMPLCGCPDYYFDDSSNVDCQECLLGCQVCTNSSSCQTCKSGTNRSGSTCQCQDGFYDDFSSQNCIQCTYPCITCNSTQCLSCGISTPTRDSVTCECPNGYYNQGTTAQCQQCVFPCINCTSNTDCLSCVVSSPIRTTSLCICDDRYYDDNSTPQCQDCLSGCETCLNNSSCQTCKTSVPARSGSQCLCPSKYFDDGVNDTCQECIHGCDVCDNATTCTTCIVGSFRIDSDCKCQYSYFHSGPETCSSCNYKCATCISNENNCQTCSDVNRDINSSPKCQCALGYIEQGSSNPICATCKYNCNGCTGTYDNCDSCTGLNRKNNQPTCSCVDNYYDNGSNADCQICPFIGCETCTQQVCLTCLGDTFQDYSRKINNETGNLECICPDKYFHLTNQDNCQICQQQCATCVNNEQNCLTCKGNRITIPDCVCPYHQYDDESEDCKECQDTCEVCDKDECQECRTNRQIQGASSKDCFCLGTDIDHYTENPSTLWCTSCSVGVFVATFTEDYSQINVVFYDDIYINDFDQQKIFSSSLCSHVIDLPQHSDNLGDIPQCRLYNKREFQIKLGRGPTILKQNKIYLKQNVIGREACISGPYFFTDFPTIILYQHENSLPPSIELNNPTSTISLCQDVSIQISKILYDGGRGLKNFNWSLVSSTASDQQSLIDIMNQTNSNSLSFLNIPALTLKENSEYKIILQFENFVDLVAIYSFTIFSGSSKGAYVEIDQIKPFVFKNWKSNQINAQIQYLDCSSGSFQEIKSDLIVTWDDITNINNPIQLENYSTNQKQVKRIIEPYTSVPGKTYTIEIKVNIEGNSNLEASQFVGYLVEISPLIAYIEGGNRLHAYAQPLELIAVGKDPDVPLVDQELNLTKSWSCINLGNQTPCETIDGQLLKFNSTNNVEFQKKIFEPYNSYQYTYNLDKVGKNSEQGIAIIIVVETDLPILSVKVPENILNNKINKNDDLQVDINFDGDYNEVFISLIFLYRYEVVATKSFDFPSFAFKIWDHFNDFNSDENQFLLRVSLYDPSYFMPSQTTFSVSINFEPKLSIIKIIPQKGIAIQDDFLIQLEGFFDEDQPISYKYQYYKSNNDYLSEKQIGSNQIQIKKNTIVDYTNENSLVTKLPKGQFNPYNQQHELLIMVSVSDSLGAITNVTETIQVSNQVNQSFQNYLDNFQIYIDDLKPLSKSKKIQLLNIMASDISRQGIENCYNDCSGNGICNLVTLKCQCNTGYYLLDCSQNEISLFSQYVDLQKQLYDQLYNLQESITSKVIKDQVMKSLNILMKEGQISSILSQEEINSNINILSDTVSTQVSEIDNIIDNNLINTGDSLSTRQYTQITEILGKTVETIDSLFKVFNENDKRVRNRQLIEENINQSQKNLVTVQKSVNQAFQKASLPNSDPLGFEGEFLKCDIQKLTNKKIESKFFKNESQNIIEGFKNEIKVNSQELSDQDKQSFDQNNPNNDSIYTSSINSYKNNPYSQDENFPYKDQIYSVNDIDITNIDLDGEEITISQNITMGFSAVSEEIEKNVCISKSNNGNWDNQKCQTVEKETTDGTVEIKCQCVSLQPATVIEDLNGLFSESLADEVFSDDGLEALKSFDFWNSIMFYLFLTETIIVILSIIYGYSQDKQDFSKERKKKCEQFQQQQIQIQEDMYVKSQRNNKINQLQNEDVISHNLSKNNKQSCFLINEITNDQLSVNLNQLENINRKNSLQVDTFDTNTQIIKPNNNYQNQFQSDIDIIKTNNIEQIQEGNNIISQIQNNQDNYVNNESIYNNSQYNFNTQNELINNKNNNNDIKEKFSTLDENYDKQIKQPKKKKIRTKISSKNLHNNNKNTQVKDSFQDNQQNQRKKRSRQLQSIIQNNDKQDNIFQNNENLSKDQENSNVQIQNFIKSEQNNENNENKQQQQQQSIQNENQLNNQSDEDTFNNQKTNSVTLSSYSFTESSSNSDSDVSDYNNEIDINKEQQQDQSQQKQDNIKNINQLNDTQNDQINQNRNSQKNAQFPRNQENQSIKIPKNRQKYEESFKNLPIEKIDDNSIINTINNDKKQKKYNQKISQISNINTQNNIPTFRSQLNQNINPSQNSSNFQSSITLNNDSNNQLNITQQQNSLSDQNSSKNNENYEKKLIIFNNKQSTGMNKSQFQKYNKFQQNVSDNELNYQLSQTNSFKEIQQDTIDENKPIPQDKLKDVSEGIIKLHDFFGIFIVYQEKLNRPQRFLLYYLKTSILMAVSSLFCQNLNQVQSLLLSLFSTVLSGIPSALIQKLFAKHKLCTTILACIIFLICLFISLYIALTVAALLGVEKSNEWVISYFTSFSIELFIFDPIKTTSKLILVRRSLIIGKQNCIVKILADKEILNFLKNKKNE